MSSVLKKADKLNLSLSLASLPVPVVPEVSTRVSTGSGWVPPE